MSADPAPLVVVAAALRDGDGRVLAAQRTYPPELAGYWELPGGKVEPGERDEDALVRELREELGVTVVLGERVPGEWPIAPPYVLRLWVAALAGPDERPQAVEHAAIRWVEAARLHEVAWIPGDQVVVAALMAHLAQAPGSPADSVG